MDSEMNSTNSDTGKVSATFTNTANISREERHYCACLFAWLLGSPENCRAFLKKIYCGGAEPEWLSGTNRFVITYECTLIRDWLYFLLKNEGRKSHDDSKKLCKDYAEFDVSKKKPDLAIFEQESKTLILFEAKFDEGFDHNQIIKTQNYDDLVSDIEIEDDKVTTVIVVLIGLAYYLNSYLTKYPPADQGDSRLQTIAWESILQLIPEKHPTKEALKAGLERQYQDHPRVRAWTKQNDFANIDDKGKIL